MQPTYTQQPFPQQPYPSQNFQYPPYPNNPPGGYAPGPYSAGQYYPQQPQVIYRERNSGVDTNTCWLISLLTLCCGCLIGDVCCDADVCCCIIPCIPLPRFRR
uniref:Cysteine-rich transmembrane CYSTM domain-containing protein n=1 Tax=Acrobeloides nanus TaxID=290746 RepID=A0A914CYW8_9BILA